MFGSAVNVRTINVRTTIGSFDQGAAMTGTASTAAAAGEAAISQPPPLPPLAGPILVNPSAVLSACRRSTSSSHQERLPWPASQKAGNRSASPQEPGTGPPG